MCPLHITLEDYWINSSSLNPPYMLTIPCFAQVVNASWNNLGAIFFFFFFCLFSSSSSSKLSLKASYYLKSSLTTFLWIKFLFFLLSSYAMHPSLAAFIPPCHAYHACFLTSLHLPLICEHLKDRNYFQLLGPFHLTQCLSHSLLMHQ